MIVAVPTYENHSGSPICVSFGRTPYFLFFDTEKDAGTYLPNPAADAAGGAGVVAAQFVVDQKAEALITVRAGQNAADVLKAADVAVWRAVSGPVEQNLKQFMAGKLSPLDNFHVGFHGHV